VKRVAVGGDGDTDAGGYGGGEAGGVEPPAPVITSGDPLLPTRYNPELLRARWSRTCPRCVRANMTDCNLRKGKTEKERRGRREKLDAR